MAQEVNGERANGKRRNRQGSSLGFCNCDLYFPRRKPEIFQPGTRRSAGCSRDELSRIDYLYLIHPDFREIFKKQTELAIAGDTSGLPKEPEIQAIRKNSEFRWVQIRPQIIKYCGKPAVPGIAGDITERKRGEDSLRESETHYRLLAESLSDVIWVIDSDSPNRTTCISPSVTKLLGYNVSEANIPSELRKYLPPFHLRLRRGLFAALRLL